ncbi:MAG: cupin domain-containing protein [Elusimicrobia bacterium]|nr:cupin domain-containing protein [Elusimicrobiota bacterium]MDE2510218.1 cupin domain-containing protein [Elusimicrobiota bacterium]
MTAEDLAARLNLAPHPEGGFYRETYRAADGACTAIFYLLPAGAKSNLHRIKSDELWHHHLGGALEIVEIGSGGRVETTVLGPDLEKGEVLQKVVAAGRWFGARPRPGTEWALAGCTVAPAFRFADFELARRAELLKTYPAAAAEILALTD